MSVLSGLPQKYALSECIESSVRTDFVRCGTIVSSGYPVLNVQIPEPTHILFNISASGGAPGTTESARTLTPLNGGASFAPFSSYDTITSSSFKITVFFDDGSYIDTYSEEADSSVTTIVYFSHDEACATVDGSRES